MTKHNQTYRSADWWKRQIDHTGLSRKEVAELLDIREARLSQLTSDGGGVHDRERFEKFAALANTAPYRTRRLLEWVEWTAPFSGYETEYVGFTECGIRLAQVRTLSFDDVFCLPGTTDFVVACPFRHISTRNLLNRINERNFSRIVFSNESVAPLEGRKINLGYSTHENNLEVDGIVYQPHFDEKSGTYCDYGVMIVMDDTSGVTPDDAAKRLVFASGAHRLASGLGFRVAILSALRKAHNISLEGNRVVVFKVQFVKPRDRLYPEGFEVLATYESASETASAATR